MNPSQPLVDLCRPQGVEGGRGEQDRTSLRLGLEALFMGIGKDLANFDKFMSIVHKFF